MSSEFDERSIDIFSEEEVPGEIAETVAIYMRLSYKEGHKPKDHKEHHADLIFVGGNGLHLSLLDIPVSQLLTLARFIKDNVKEWKES